MDVVILVFVRFEDMEEERESITKNFKDIEKGVEQLFRDIYEVRKKYC